MLNICLSHKLIPQTSVDKSTAYLVSQAFPDKLIYRVSLERGGCGLCEDIIERHEYRVKTDSIFFIIVFLILPNLRLMQYVFKIEMIKCTCSFIGGILRYELSVCMRNGRTEKHFDLDKTNKIQARLPFVISFHFQVIAIFNNPKQQHSLNLLSILSPAMFLLKNLNRFFT